MTPQELAEIDRKVAEAIGDTSTEHEWDKIGGNYYGNGYVCRRCGEAFVEDTLEYGNSQAAPCVRPFSRDWSDAMFAAEKAGLTGILVNTPSMGPPFFLCYPDQFKTLGLEGSTAPTGPLAICDAILKLKGIQ